MSEQVMYLSNNVKTYSENLKNLINDIGDELNKGIKDGFAYSLASINDDETKAFNFIKNEGYDLTYNEFSEFITDCKEMMQANEELLDKVSCEQICEELSDNDLENVAGGRGWWKKNWKKVAIGVGIAAVVGAAMVATGGLAAPILGTLAATGGGMGTMVAMGVVTANAALVTGCEIAAGIGVASIAGGVIGNILD